MSASQLTPKTLQRLLAAHPSHPRYVIAYSGGLDSTVLLHAMAALRASGGGFSLLAVHVHHGLSSHADAWVSHCQQRCADLDVTLQVCHVDARPQPGQSPEALARELRYQALAGVMIAGDCLVTAHHQDDQAETLLIQLLRGAGSHGLGAMPCYTSSAGVSHLRPLLGFSRQQLLAYAEQHSLRWVDDDSNQHTRYDRNLLRLQVMPLLQSRWPAASQTLSRSASHCAEAAELLDQLAADDLAVCAGTLPHTLAVAPVQQLTPARQRNLLRYWLRQCGLPLPDRSQLLRLQQDLLYCATDAAPHVHWAGCDARRYRDQIYALTAPPAHDAAQVLPWSPGVALRLPTIGQHLVANAVVGQGIDTRQLAGAQVTVRFRQGGERIRPVGRADRHALKALLQEAGVPPWQRDRIPLIFLDNALVMVVGYWLAEGCAASPGEPGLDFVLQPIRDIDESSQ